MKRTSTNVRKVRAKVHAGVRLVGSGPSLLSVADMRALVRTVEEEIWADHPNRARVVQTLVPRLVLDRIGGSVHRDAFANSVCFAAERRRGRMGHLWVPRTPLARGLYARTAIYIASIGPGASELVDDLHVSIDLAVEWDYEYPVQASEVARRGAFRAGGLGAARKPDRSCATARDAIDVAAMNWVHWNAPSQARSDLV
jgi:hypothetical protein